MTADRARRRAVLMLAALAGAMLLAGVLPWATGAETAIRFLAVPLFLAGLMVLGVTLRVWAAGRRPPAPPVQRGCAGCVCGLNGSCATDRSSADTPAQSASAGDPAVGARHTGNSPAEPPDEPPDDRVPATAATTGADSAPATHGADSGPAAAAVTGGDGARPAAG